MQLVTADGQQFDPRELMAGLQAKGQVTFEHSPQDVNLAREEYRRYHREYKRRWRAIRRMHGMPV